VRYIFHLSVPVPDLAEAERFYVGVLGGSIGRRAESWIDVLIWGHQITLQLRPEEVLPLNRQGKRHFGVILPWQEWAEQAGRLDRNGARSLSPPVVMHQGTDEEQAKIYLEDPGHNIIEIKAYRQLRKTVGNGDAAYEYRSD
jgi:extradiol dioxygenase family protein